jgi:uncharacterized membrane protein
VGDIPSLSGYAIFSIQATSILFVLVYLVHSYKRLGVKTATEFFVISAVLGYTFEYLFISTGWLGTYVYTADLSPFIGPIPVFIPLLWASLSYFCMIAAGDYIVAAVLMVLLDLSFDPRFAVTLWRWVPPGQYFGVPLANFAGWFVTAAAIFVVFYLVSRKKTESSTPAIIFYLLFGIFNGVLPDLSAGLAEAGAISLVLFLGASLALYLNLRRVGTARMVVSATAAVSPISKAPSQP